MNRRLLPLTITVLLFIGMAAFGALRYPGFLSLQVFLNLPSSFSPGASPCRWARWSR